jgi:ribulose-5-phosphate 4-epimerase/fuculose-1-phosphate aldolase
MSMTNAQELPQSRVAQLVSPEEWQTRVELAACYRLVAYYGWDDMIFTHISARVPGPEHHFLINPYGVLFEEITASMLMKVDLDGRVVLDAPYPVNPAGFVIHSAIHGARPDARCVLHLHTKQGQAVAAQAGGLLPITQTAMTLHGDIAYHEYEGLANNLEERARLVADLGQKHCLILRNHGTLTVGEEVSDAFMRMYFLERACEAQIMALAGGAPIHPAPSGTPELTAEVANLGLPLVGRGLAWPALRRKLDRLDPSYRS